MYFYSNRPDYDTSLCFKSKDLSGLNESLAKTQSMLDSTKAKRKAFDKSNQNLQVEFMERSLKFLVKLSSMELF